MWLGWAEKKGGEGGMFIGVYLKPFFWFGIFSSLPLFCFSFTKPYKYPRDVVWELGTLTVGTKNSKDRIKHSLCLFVQLIEGATGFLSGWRGVGRSEELFPRTDDLRLQPRCSSLSNDLYAPRVAGHLQKKKKKKKGAIPRLTLGCISGVSTFVFLWKMIALMTIIFLHNLAQFSVIFYCQWSPGHSVKKKKKWESVCFADECNLNGLFFFSWLNPGSKYPPDCWRGCASSSYEQRDFRLYSLRGRISIFKMVRPQRRAICLQWSNWKTMWILTLDAVLLTLVVGFANQGKKLGASSQKRHHGSARTWG